VQKRYLYTIAWAVRPCTRMISRVGTGQIGDSCVCFSSADQMMRTTLIDSHILAGCKFFELHTDMYISRFGFRLAIISRLYRLRSIHSNNTTRRRRSPDLGLPVFETATPDKHIQRSADRFGLALKRVRM
jgi:hypothetical protein